MDSGYEGIRLHSDMISKDNFQIVPRPLWLGGIYMPSTHTHTRGSLNICFVLFSRIDFRIVCPHAVLRCLAGSLIVM